jgi:hypothetical protein
VAAADNGNLKERMTNLEKQFNKIPPQAFDKKNKLESAENGEKG